MSKMNKRTCFRKASFVMASMLAFSAADVSMMPFAAEAAEEESVSNVTFESGETKNEAGTALQYRWYAPADVKEDEKYPVVLFLHGSDAAGTDNELQLTTTKGAVFYAEEGEALGNPAFVLAPQSETGDWTDQETTELLKQMLDEFAAEHPVDTDRIYIEGMDTGATGVWNMIVTYPDYFAAAIPMCGTVPESFYKDNAYEKLTTLPIWAYHVADDDVVSAEETVKATDALKEAGSTVLQFEEFTAGSVTPAHDVWNVVYSIGTPYHWMMSQTRANYADTDDVSMLYYQKTLEDDVTAIMDYYQGKIYVIDEGDHALVVDSGMGGFGNADLYGYIHDNVLTNPEADLDLLITHNHGDHILGVPSLLSSGHVNNIYIHPDDKDGFVETMGKFEVAEDSMNIVPVKEGDVVTVGDKEVDIVDVPGHTPGSIVAFYDNYIFTGDAVGSGDLWIFSLDTMKELPESIGHFNDKIKEGNKDYELLTGHYENLKPFTTQYVEDMLELVNEYNAGTAEIGVYTRRDGAYIGYGDAHIFFPKEENE